MNAVHQQLHSGGKRVPWLTLCRLLAVARSKLCYQAPPRQRDEAVDEPLSAPINEIIEERPAFGVRRPRPHGEPQESAPHHASEA
jgi:hypothetical protein